MAEGDLPVAPGIFLPARDLSWVAVRASGPGGQNVNKVSSKVELRFDLEGSRALHEGVKARLRGAAKRFLRADGALVVPCQRERDQSRNLELAREHLAELVRAALLPPTPRTATKPTRASKRRRVADKRARSETKRVRRDRPAHE
jgi:ribosome-associated protein